VLLAVHAANLQRQTLKPQFAHSAHAEEQYRTCGARESDLSPPHRPFDCQSVQRPLVV
jgi:hypothetical protein